METTPRATKRAFFTDLAGGHRVEFQFTPHELDFSEGGEYAERKKVGSYNIDYVWINGKTHKFNLFMFIDRTQESYIDADYGKDPFEGIKRFPNNYPKYTGIDAVNMVRGIERTGSSTSGFEASFRKHNTASTGGKVSPSKYSASPEFKQDPLMANSGVLIDLEALLYYVRPLGMSLTNETIQTIEGTDSQGKYQQKKISLKDFSQSRFIPPPMVRFYYGSFWKEGYITNVKYKLSVMNKLLVPRRMEADIEMTCTRWGYLSEIPIESISSAVDVKIN